MVNIKPDSEETVQLISQARAGDPAAFSLLFERHRPGLRKFLHAHFDFRLNQRLDSSDLVQETMVEAIRDFESYVSRQPMPFHLWLRKTAYQRLSKSRRFHQAARRDMRRESMFPEHSSKILSHRLLNSGSEMARRSSLQEWTARVHQVLARMVAHDREVLTLRIVDELSHEEIACLLDLEAATVRKRFARALLRLRGLLADEGMSEFFL